jgi:60 kDa SS-A/Ro ribonucleoprotein
MLFASRKPIPGVEGFIVLTDNETWYGNTHPIEAVGQYREKFEVPSKLVSMAFVAHGYSVQPVEDAGSLGVVGFDANVPGIIQDFMSQPLGIRSLAGKKE